MRTFCVLIALVPLSIASAAAEPLKPGERQRLIAHFEMTESWLASEVDGLSSDQVKFRPTAESWSILEVVEHLAVAEPQYWKQLQDSMQQPPTTEKGEATDAAILWYGIDRTNRQRTGEARVPKGRWDDLRGSHGEFRKLRATMLEYARNSQEDMRARKLIGGNMDVYQWFLMISSHSQRHILQIREIKAHSGFPKK